MSLLGGGQHGVGGFHMRIDVTKKCNATAGGRHAAVPAKTKARQRGFLRAGFGSIAAALLFAVTGCASTSEVETAALARTPIAPGKARVTIKRTNEILYAGAPATITLNGQNAASVAVGGSAVVDVPAGNNVLTASAWSYPGEFSVQLNAVAGQTYALEVAPRSASFGPSLLGPVGGLIDSSANGNAAGAFEIRGVGTPPGSVVAAAAPAG